MHEKKQVLIKKGLCITAMMLAVCSVGSLLTSCNLKKEEAAGATYPPLVLGGTPSAGGEVDEIETDGPGGKPVETPVATEAPVLPAFDEIDFSFSGNEYCLADAVTGEIYMSHNADKQTYIASITKLLTGLTALDYFSPDQEITVKSEWLELMRTDSDIDGFGIKAGETYTVEDYLKMLIIKSYGDAALVLQYATAEVAGIDFLELMNRKAKAMGMKDSHFDNPIGLDTGNGFHNNYSTAEDVVKLMVAAYKNPVLFDACCMRSAVVSNGKKLVSTVPIYGDKYQSDVYEVLGGKTGSTNASGVSYTCVAADSDTDRKYIVVYLNGHSSTDMYNEIAYLLNQIC
ncbi:MAG: D-alanyl-D-alanine carboxypeptidase [Clostridia bacterium]|nr:D-alanyl-D-alanine carboxypeptidase [Clostridia bacterium]